MLTTMTLQNLAKKIGETHGTSTDLPSGLHWDSPVPDQLFILDESCSGEDCILDGRKRFFHFLALAEREMIPWDLTLSVKILNIRKEMSFPIPTELSELPTGILNVPYIRSFLLLKQDPHSEKKLDEEKISELTRGIYRHLMNNLKSNHTNPVTLVKLVADLNGFLNQTNIATILRRSEGWVSDTIAVSKLPLDIFASMEYGEISYSAAVVIARAESEKERDILFRLAKKLDVRSLRDALRYIITAPKLLAQKNAFENLLNMFSRKVLDVGGRARLQLQVGVERSLRKFFRSRQEQNSKLGEGKPGKDPQSLVFRLKISIDGEDADDLTQIAPGKVEKMRKSILGSLKTAMV